MANIKTENRRRKLRQQQKHTNQILGLILGKSIRTKFLVLYLGEKNNRRLTLRRKRRKEYQPSFVISVAKNSVRRKVRDPLWFGCTSSEEEPVSSETGKEGGGKLTATLGRSLKTKKPESCFLHRRHTEQLSNNTHTQRSSGGLQA